MLRANDCRSAQQSHKSNNIRTSSKVGSGRIKMSVIEQYFDSQKSQNRRSSKAMSQSRIKNKLSSAKLIDELVQSGEELDFKDMKE